MSSPVDRTSSIQISIKHTFIPFQESKMYKLIAAIFFLLFSGAVSTCTASDDGQVNTVLQKRLEIFIKSQKPHPYGTYQYTDRELLLALNKNPSQIYLVDVRTPSYNDFFCGAHSDKHVCTGRGWQRIYGYIQGHVPGAVNIPYLGLAKAVKENKIPKNKTIVFMCPTGQLSNQVSGVFRMLGYKSYALRGGVNGWKKNGYPISIGDQPGNFSTACHPWQKCWRQFTYDNPQAH